MEHIGDSVVTSVLTDALTRHLRYLELELELHESSQPHQGKGVETSTDLALTEYFRSRTAITQSCLLVVGKVAEAVRRFIREEEDGDGSDVDRRKGKWIEPEPEPKDDNLIDFDDGFPPIPHHILQTVWEEDDDEPFMNPMTGQWIYPVTSKSAGPSGTQGLCESPTRKPSLGKKQQMGPLPVRSSVKRVEEKTLPGMIFDMEKSTSPEIQSKTNPKPSIKSKSRFEAKPEPKVDLASILRADLLDLDTDELPPYEALIPGPIFPPTNPFADPLPSHRSARSRSNSSSSTVIDTPESTPGGTDSESRDVFFDHGPEPPFSFAAIGPSQLELDRLAAQKLQAQLDGEAEDEFQRLQEEWARQDRLLEEQNAFAQAMRRNEEAREDAIRRDQAAARALRAQWEEEARAEEESTRRLIEQFQREEEENAERIIVAAKEAKRLAEQWDREEEEERERLLEEERRRRQADCVVCMEPSDKDKMCLLSCNHYYDRECIAAAFKNALKSRAPFACCGRTVPASQAARFLPAKTVTSHDLLVLELSTPNPRYCSNRSCRLFIPPSSVRGPLATCPTCHTRTCALCNNAEHAGVCPEDRAGAAVIALAKGKGWKTCPRCKAILEKTHGCLHMSCRCGAQWCYNCLRDWGTCNSTCSRT